MACQVLTEEVDSSTTEANKVKVRRGTSIADVSVGLMAGPGKRGEWGPLMALLVA